MSLAQLGISGSVKAADLWTGRSLDIVRGGYTVTVTPAGVSLISGRPRTGTSRTPAVAPASPLTRTGGTLIRVYQPFRHALLSGR